MGWIARMLGRIPAAATRTVDDDARLDELTQKYQSLLTVAEQQRIRFRDLDVQDGKLFIRGQAPSEEATRRFWDQIREVNPAADDITVEISSRADSVSAALSGTR